MAREHFAQRAHAKADKRIRRGIAELRAHAYAFGNISLRKWRGEIPWLRLRSARDKRRHLFGRNGLSARVSERDFLQLGIEMYRVFAHKLDQKLRGRIGHGDAMRCRHGAHLGRQFVCLARRAIDDRLRANRRRSLIEARVFRKLIRKQRQHREIGWRCEIRDERFRIGFLQIVGISHDNEAFVDAEGHGVARSHDIAAQCIFAVERIAVEIEVAHRFKARTQALKHGFALKLVFAVNQIRRQQVHFGHSLLTPRSSIFSDCLF